MDSPLTTRLDVRPVEPRDRFPLITAAYDAVPEGGTLDLLMDHDPKCMYYTLEATREAGSFHFEYLEDGPEVWRVAVTKTTVPDRTAHASPAVGCTPRDGSAPHPGAGVPPTDAKLGPA